MVKKSQNFVNVICEPPLRERANQLNQILFAYSSTSTNKSSKSRNSLIAHSNLHGKMLLTKHDFVGHDLEMLIRLWNDKCILDSR